MYERRSHDAKADLDEAIGNLSIGRGPRFVPQDGNDLDESLQLSQQAPQHRPIEIPTNVPGRDPGGDDISPKSRVGEGWHAALGPKEGYTPTVNLDRRVSCERIVCCVSIGSSGKLFAAGCIQFIHVCEVETGQILQTFHHGTEIYVKNVCFSPDESLLAAGDSNGTIRICNMTDGSQRGWVHDPFATFANHPLKGYVSVHFSPRGDRLVSGGIDGKVRIWDVATGKEVSCLDAGDVVDAVAVSDKYIAAGLADAGGVRVWNIESGDKVADLAGADGHQKSVFAVAWDRDRVFSASLDGKLKEWQLNIAGGRYAAFDGAKCVRTYEDHGFGFSVGLMSDWILSCSGREVLLRQRGSGSVESRLDGHKGDVMSVDGNSEHGIIVSGSQGGMAYVWRLGKRPVDKTA